MPGQSERRKLRGQIHQLLRVGIVERTQDHAVDDREDGRIRADSQCQRQERHRREHGSAPKRAQPMAHVARQVVEPRQASLIPQRVHGLRSASRRNARRAQGIAGVETTTSRVLRRHCQMRPHLVFELGVAPPLQQCSLKTANPFAKDAQAISGLTPRRAADRANQRLKDQQIECALENVGCGSSGPIRHANGISLDH